MDYAYLGLVMKTVRNKSILQLHLFSNTVRTAHAAKQMVMYCRRSSRAVMHVYIIRSG